MDDAFIAFWSGMGGGLVLGIMVAAILTAIANRIEERRIPNQEAIRVISDELKHCEFHIHDDNKAPEYYQEMQELIDSYRHAIEAMKAVGGEKI